MKLIDAEPLIKKFEQNRKEFIDIEPEASFAYEIARQALEEAPTVEAMPIEWLEQIAEKISPATIEIDIPHNLLVFTSKRFVEVLTELWRRHFTADQIADGEWVRRQTNEDN